MLPECEGLGAVELGTLLDFAKTTLAGELVLFGTHLDVVLGVAADAMGCEEGAVTTIQNVHIRISQVRVGINIDSSVMVPNVLGHDGGPVGRILAMKNERSTRLGLVKQLGSKSILVIVVEGTINMAAFIFVFKTAIDDNDVVELTIVVPIQHVK